MKRLIPVLACLCLLWTGCGSSADDPLFGQGPVATEKRLVGVFDALSLDLQANVEVVRDSIAFVEITAQPNLRGNIQVLLTGKALSIDQTAEVDYDELVKVVVHINGPLKSISNRLRGDLLCLDTVGRDSLELSKFTYQHLGNGATRLNVIAPSVQATHAGKGNVVLGGSADTYVATLMKNGKGEVSAFGLEAAAVTATLEGEGELHVYATESLKAKVSGKGSIRYRGLKPEDVQSSVSGAGAVVKVD